MKLRYWALISVVTILSVRGCHQSFKEMELSYNTKQLEIYTMFAPSVVRAKINNVHKEMTVIISEVKDPMDFASTKSKEYAQKVCSFQIRYNFPVGLKNVIVLHEYGVGKQIITSQTKCKSLKVDAVSSASGKS